VTVEHEAIVRRAIDSFEGGTADFSDYIILECSRQANARPVLTFVQRFAREADVQMVAPKE
jgi:predicted nucleic-acid-binding protein